MKSGDRFFLFFVFFFWDSFFTQLYLWTEIYGFADYIGPFTREKGRMNLSWAFKMPNRHIRCVCVCVCVIDMHVLAFWTCLQNSCGTRASCWWWHLYFLVFSNENICSDPLWEVITFILFLFSFSFQPVHGIKGSISCLLFLRERQMPMFASLYDLV